MANGLEETRNIVTADDNGNPGWVVTNSTGEQYIVSDPVFKKKYERIADTAAKYGIYFTPGDNQRIPGWMQVHYRLQFSKDGYARMYVFNNCKAFIRTMPLMMYSETHPEDLDTKLEDHCPDEVRYMCMSRPISPIMHIEPKPIISDPLNQFN